jgi:hypothetical protein
MAKVSGSYKSLIRGVSEQVPEERLPGQHAAQDNTLSDPVRGLVRRQGSVLVRETPFAPADHPGDLAAYYRCEDIKIEDRELTVAMRRPGAPSGGFGNGPAVWMIQRGVYPGTNDGAVLPSTISPAATTELALGVNAHAVVGRFLLLAHNRVVNDADTAALVTIVKSNPGVVLTDGLSRLNGSAYATVANGSISMDDVPTGDITITVAGAATALLPARKGLYFDVQVIKSSGISPWTPASGDFTIRGDVTRATA